VDELENKYRTNTLSSDEWDVLRDRVNGMSDQQLATQLFEEWMNDDIDTSSVDSKQMDKLKGKIDRSTSHFHHHIRHLSKIAGIAAAILLPVFILTTLHFYTQTRQMESEEMTVATGDGERANITLPDGTSVALNSNSKLNYTPKVYNKDLRAITFSGEGYFQVQKDARRPFLISSKGLSVKVLGTTFNLQARNDKPTAELALEKGSVLFSSTMTKKNVTLDVGYRAILEQHTGNIIIICEKDVLNAAAWKHGYLSFHETALADVIKNIETNFGINITIPDNCLSDLFTGTLPTTDLNETLLILEKSYHLKSTPQGKNIILSKD
jgi:transmembrane sensor